MLSYRGMRKHELSEYFSKLGKKGGRKGGLARAKNLSAEQRTEIARKAGKARAAKAKKTKGKSK